jgi:phenylacetaldehyde dehydrogenase
LAAFWRKENETVHQRQVDCRAERQDVCIEDSATEETITHVPAGDKADIYLAVAGARRFSKADHGRGLLPRKNRLVWRLADLLEKYADEFTDL